MRKFISKVLAGGISVLLLSCNVQISSDEGVNPDFSKLQTYKWANSTRQNAGGKFNRAGKGERIVELNINPSFIEENLQKKGFNSDSTQPDFLVRCKAFYEKEDNSANLDWTKPGNATRSPGWGSNTQNSSGMKMVPEKTTVVILELLDPVSEEVLWRGVKTTVVGEMLNLTEILEKDIQLIIKKIPSQQSSKNRK